MAKEIKIILNFDYDLDKKKVSEGRESPITIVGPYGGFVAYLENEKIEKFFEDEIEQLKNRIDEIFL